MSETDDFVLIPEQHLDLLTRVTELESPVTALEALAEDCAPRY